MAYRKILLALDLSTNTQLLCYKARDLANCNQSQLSLVHVVEPLVKKALGEELIRRWPALGHDLRKERASRYSYYQRMFEAVALGSMCLKTSINNAIKQKGKVQRKFTLEMVA